MKRFTWDLGAYCNFKCSYCFYSEAGWERMAQLQGSPRSPGTMEEAWKDIFDRYGKACVYITGGEPFLYPSFADIVTRISRFHKVHITSNLSQALDELVQQVSPSEVTFNSTFHPRYMDCMTFVRQVQKLKDAGFTCGVCYLAHPAQIREMLQYKRVFRGFGIDMTLNVFWGKYDGKDYPKDYTEQEKEFYEYVALWTEKSGNRLPSKKPATDDAQLLNLQPAGSEGDRCGAGSSYAVIGLDGSVRPCGQLPGPVLGNLFGKSVKLYDEQRRCTARYCRCREVDYAGT